MGVLAIIAFVLGIVAVYLSNKNSKSIKEINIASEGPVGPQGIEGPVGPQGRDGVDGINGKDGVDGINGKDGVDGINGKDGVDGKDGINGKDGVDGINGAQGPQGPNGPVGPIDESLREEWKRFKGEELNQILDEVIKRHIEELHREK